jgi:hypothetical protein
MRKFVGAILIAVGVFLFGAALVLFFTNVLPSILAVVGEASSYAIGRTVGGILVFLLFVLLGRKSFKAGRARFADTAPTSTSPGQPPITPG